MRGAQGRVADALLRNVGGETVLLRMPQPAVEGDLNEELGLGTPGFQDALLGPVVFRRVRARVGQEAVEYELLVSARAVEKLVGSLEYESASVLFREALGVVVHGAVLTIAGATGAEAFGSVYLYRLKCVGAEGVRI